MTRSIFFSAKDAQRLPQRVLKISACYDKPFSVHFEKTQGGGLIHPPRRSRVNINPMTLHGKNSFGDQKLTIRALPIKFGK